MDKKIGFIGLGTMGFPMCFNLYKAGYSLNLPIYRIDEDAASGYSDLVPDRETKLAKIQEMLDHGAKAMSSQAELAAKSDIVMMSMPNSALIEKIMNGDDGIIANIRPGSVVIDLSSADPMSTRRLSAKLEKKGVHMMDAPVSGGAVGSIAHSLSMMVGGDEELFHEMLPILRTIGNPEKIQYVGTCSAGHMLKAANNFLSALCTAATTEAIAVCAKSGIDPVAAAKVIAGSGGRSDASMNKYPNYIFPGKNFHFTLNLMTKDIGLFVSAAKDLKVPAFLANTTNQLWNIPVAMGKGNEDCMELVRMLQSWAGVELIGIKKEEK